MASDRLRLPPSPRGRTSPTRRRGSAASETRPDGLKILQQIQTTYLPPSDLPMSASRSTTGSQIAPDRNKHEDIRTIKEKVRKTDCLTGKGLLAADLIKNLQSQKNLTAARPFNRAVSAGVHERRPVTDVKQMQRPRSENSNQRTASNGFNSGRRCSLPAPTLKQKARVADDILRKYNCGDETNNKALTQSSNTEVSLPSLKKVASANRLTTIYHDSAEEEDGSKNSSESKSKYLTVKCERNKRRSSLSALSDTRLRPKSSSKEQASPSAVKKSQRVQSATGKNEESQNGESNRLSSVSKAAKTENEGPRSKKVSNKFENSGKKTGTKNTKPSFKLELDESDTSISSDSDSENSIENEHRRVSNRRTGEVSKHEKKIANSSDSESDTNSESEKKCTQAHDVRKTSNKKQTKCKRNNRKEHDINDGDSNSKGNNEEKKVAKHGDSDESVDSSDDDTSSHDHDHDHDSESESEKEGKNESRTEREKDRARRGKESESEDETRQGSVEFGGVFSEEELAELSKKMIAPGMPAVDLLETHDKLLVEGVHRGQKECEEASKKDSIADDDEVDDPISDNDEVDDLIDHIDDLIDADDDDITYENKQRRKSLKRAVKSVMSANVFSHKDS